jgi:site-specific DNA recombinase
MIRVSKEREGMVSPENQRYSIEQYAERANIEVVEWIEGIDESGSRKKSAWWARLDRGIELVEAHSVDVLVVWRIDRTARNRLKWAIATDRIETAGGYIESATEPNDRSPAGRFGRGMMAEHAAFMAESIGATWKETLERRVRHGMTPNGQRHFGYTYTREDGYLIDPIEGPALAEMFRAYTAGDSAWQIADRLNGPVEPPADGANFPRHARWNTASVLRVLDSGFGAGFIQFRGELHDGMHAPIIEPDEWTRFRHARESRRRRPRAERSAYLYSGFIWCHCGGKMGGRTDHGRPRYACIESATYKPHADASLAAHVIDAEVKRWLNKIRDELNDAARKAPRRPILIADPAKDISRRLAAIADRFDSATLKFVDDAIPAETYERLRSRFEAESAALNAELARVSAQATVRPLAFVGDLVAQWDDLPVQRRREALRLLVDRIVIHPPDAEKRVEVFSDLTRS